MFYGRGEATCELQKYLQFLQDYISNTPIQGAILSIELKRKTCFWDGKFVRISLL